MVAAIVIAGIWGIWKALVQRRYTETAGGLALSVVFVVIALFFVYQPERTVGEASRLTNTLSLAFLAGANQGSLDDPSQAKRQVADHLFDTLVYKPWVVLEFGGLEHCVDTSRLDDDGFPRPVGPHDPARDVCRDHVRAGRDGHGGYAPRFLRRPAGSEERKAEYDALREGEAPNDPQFKGYSVDKSDAPAVDIQQEGGAFQRLTFSVVVLLGALGAVALLGFLSLAVILAQVVALVLLGFAPVALVIGIFPGAGHAFFRAWLTKLATAVFIKALYSLVIAIVVAVSAALASATGSLGFLFAFGLQTIFFWALFLYRRQITARLVGATTGAAAGHGRPTVVQRGAHAAARPVTALVGVPRHGAGDRRGRQESALAGGKPADAGQPDVQGAAAPVDGHGRASLRRLGSLLPGRSGEVAAGAAAAAVGHAVTANGDSAANGHAAAHNGDAIGGLAAATDAHGGSNTHAAATDAHGAASNTHVPASNGHGGNANGHGANSNGLGAAHNGHGAAHNGPAAARTGHGVATTGNGAAGGHGAASNDNGAGGHGAAANGHAATHGHGASHHGHSAASNGHGAAPNGHAAPPVRRAEEPTPRASHEDVLRRARELREHERAMGLGDEGHGG